MATEAQICRPISRTYYYHRGINRSDQRDCHAAETLHASIDLESSESSKSALIVEFTVPPNAPKMSALTPEQIAFQEKHINDDKAPMVAGVTCMFLLLTFAAIAARLTARKITKVKLGFDDYCIFVAQVKAKLQLPPPRDAKN